MKFGIRVPSLKKRVSARLSIKRAIRAKIRAPRGMGMLTNPKKALYNKIYNKTSVSIDRLSSSKKRSTHSIDYALNKIEEKAHTRHIHTRGKYTCKNCNSDDWAVLSDGILIWRVECLYCEVCLKLGTAHLLSKNETKAQFLSGIQ